MKLILILIDSNVNVENLDISDLRAYILWTWEFKDVIVRLIASMSTETPLQTIEDRST